MNIKTVWYATLHEVRVLRKLLRTHVFIWVALVISSAYFLVVTLSHMHDGSAIPMLSVISPRYIMSLLSGSFIALFCIGVLLLTFDQIKRDEVTRIHEVISSKPTNDLELLSGRVLGVSITMAVPMLLFLFSVMIYGMIADLFSIKFGESVELWSAVSFVLLDIAPNFVFFGSLVIVLSMLLRSRLLALILTLSCLFTLFWLNSRLSLDVSRPLQTVSGNMLFPSELIPTLLTPMIVFNRIALCLMGVGFLYWSSCLVSRVTPAGSKDLVWGSLSFTFGLLVIGSMFGVQSLEHSRIEQWVEVHDEHFTPSSFPDVHEIRGSIDIKPGRTLSLELTLDVSVDTNQDGDLVLFSLNPGYKISHLEVAGERVNDHEFLHGLLKIPVKYFNSDRTEMGIVAKGYPDKRFAYLDSRDTLSQMVGPAVRQLRQLGTENSIFHSKFVVLQPGIKWYPTAGTATNEDAWERRKKDFFALDIEVSVPHNWLVAGPAKRELSEQNKRTTYSFKQSSPLPEFALVGSRFESASVEVEGIAFELLYSRLHRRTLEPFAQYGDSVRQWIKWRLDTVHPKGFDYPYGSFVLVEVPSSLRVFGGGVEMDTVMNPPGIVMIRESTLPTTAIKRWIEGTRQEVMERFNLTDEQFDEIEIGWIGRYLTHPLFESNIQLGLSRSFLKQQTNATGEGARALNTLLDLLTNTLSNYFITNFDFQLASNPTIYNLGSIEPIQILRSILQEDSGRIPLNIQRQLHAIYNGPEVWDAVVSHDLLHTVDEKNSTLTMRALKFRTQRLAQFLQDSLGTDNVAPLLVNLINRFRGQAFDLEEFEAVVAEHGVNLTEQAGDLIRTAALPGFLASNPSSRRLESSDQPKYETSFVLQNKEPVSGPVKLSLTYQNGEVREVRYTRKSRPSLFAILVGANQSLRVVIESSNPVQQIWVEPYLSLNRMKLRVDLPETEHLRGQEFISGELPYIKSITEVDQGTGTLNASITIDDLDPGFSVVEPGKYLVPQNLFNQFVRNLFGEVEVPMDQGLPRYSLFDDWRDPGWYRWIDPTAFGIYRRTFTIALQGDGRAFAKFTATLPESGSWQLDYHLPTGQFNEEIGFGRSSNSINSYAYVGSIHLEVRYGSTATTHTLDAQNLAPGWHSIGIFDCSAEEVDVMVSNKTDSLYRNVFADAIRWTPLKTEE